MKKNLMIIVANLQGGGQERIAALTSKILEDEYNITFVVFDDSDSKYEVSGKADFINLNIPATSNLIGKVTNVARRRKILNKLKKQINANYCLSIGRTSNIINCLSGSRGKTIVSVRNSSRLETGKRSLINNLIYHKSDAIICISEGQKDRILKYYPEISDKIFVLHNPCDINRIRRYRETEEGKNEGKTIAACGRLEGMKCYKNLFNSVRFVREEIKDVKLIVLGEGSQREELEDYIKEHNMGSYISLLGFKDEPFKCVVGCDAFAFSSAREGFPNVLIEGLASGVPVVSTDCEYGPREILSGKFLEEKIQEYKIMEYGILTPAFEEGNDMQQEKEKTFAKALIDVLQNEQLNKSMRRKGERRAEDFSVDSYKGKAIRIFNIVDGLQVEGR